MKISKEVRNIDRAFEAFFEKHRQLGNKAVVAASYFVFDLNGKCLETGICHSSCPGCFAHAMDILEEHFEEETEALKNKLNQK